MQSATRKSSVPARADKLPQLRAVHRAIDILDYLAKHGPSGLQTLHVGTGISKGALRRLLSTLAARRYVRLGLSDGMYRANVALPRGPGSHTITQVGRLVEVARPHMVALTAQTRWPCELHLYERGRIRILESTRSMTPFDNRPGLGPDSKLNIFAAAAGLAVLASRGDEFAARLVEAMKNDERWSLSRFRITPARLLGELREIRRKGFATRRVSQGRFAARNAIAVPIFDNAEAIGALSLIWNRKFATEDKFAAQYLGALQAAAEAITKGLASE